MARTSSGSDTGLLRLEQVLLSGKGGHVLGELNALQKHDRLLATRRSRHRMSRGLSSRGR